MSRLVIIILALGALLVPSMAVMADVPADADLFWYWNLGPEYNPANPIQFVLARDVYGLPPGTVPEWDLESGALRIPNRAFPDLRKELWFEVKWGITIPGDEVIDKLHVEAPSGSKVSDPIFWKSDMQGGGRIWTWKWTIVPQPDVEWIVFDPSVLRMFSNPQGESVFEIEVGSRCTVPEMNTLALASLGGFLGLPLFRRFRK